MTSPAPLPTSSTPSATSPPSPQRRGAFIVFEGLDRSGKSTQVAALVEGLNKKGVKAVAARFPDRTLTTGKMIDSYLTSQVELDDRAIHLLFSANRWERAAQILEDLNNGITVVCDRYAFSGIAFSVVKGLSWTWCQSPDVGLPSPDLVLYLTISPSCAASRGGYGSERYEKAEVQQKVAVEFERLAKSVEEGVWATVDAERGVEEVRKGIESRVERLLESGRLDGKVGKLWVTEEEEA